MNRQPKPPPTMDAAMRQFCERETLRLLPLIKRIAVRSHLPFPLEDLVQEGAKAVFLLLTKYDATRGAKPETWLGRRIHGAMRDYARAFGRMTQGGPRDRVERVLSLQSFRIESDNGKEQRLEYAVEAPPPPRRGDWGALLKGLNQRERMIVLEYFVHDRTMKAIAADLGLSESRVSQQLTNVLKRFRAAEVRDGRVREALCT